MQERPGSLSGYADIRRLASANTRAFKVRGAARWLPADTLAVVYPERPGIDCWPTSRSCQPTPLYHGTQ